MISWLHLSHNSYLRASGNPGRANLAMSSLPKGKWRDPDSNRGHHYPQLAKARSPLFLTAQKSAWITGSCIIHEHHCSPLSKLGCRHNCRQLPEKAILRTLRDVVLQFQQKLGGDERLNGKNSRNLFANRMKPTPRCSRLPLMCTTTRSRKPKQILSRQAPPSRGRLGRTRRPLIPNPAVYFRA